MDVTDLESRRKKILEFIIQTYVETAAPVGSQAVCKRFHLRLSPATVRNVMGGLEAEALLTHPHTSAGRIPTPRGYRYYVDLLMTPQMLTEAERQTIEALSQEASDDPMALLHAASRCLAALTGQVGAVVAPRLAQSALRRIDLIPMDTRRVLGVLVTAEGVLRHTVLELDEMVDAVELSRISRFLNEELSGQLLGTVEERLQQALMDATNAFNYLYRRAQELWMLGRFMDAEEVVFIEGVSHLLPQPEFHDARRSHQLVEWFEERQPVAAVLRDAMTQARHRTTIGGENRCPELEQCSVVSAPYRAGMRVAGAVGVVGPIRMEYARVSTIVDQVAEAIGHAMERFVG